MQTESLVAVELFSAFRSHSKTKVVLSFDCDAEAVTDIVTSYQKLPPELLSSKSNSENQ